MYKTKDAVKVVALLVAMVIVGHLTLYAIRLANAKTKRLDPPGTERLYRGLGRIAKFAGYSKIARKLIIAHAVAEMGGLDGNALWRGWNMWGMTQPRTWANRWNWLFPHVVLHTTDGDLYFMVFASQAEAFLVYNIMLKRLYGKAAKALKEGDIDGFLYGLTHAGPHGTRAWGTNPETIRAALNSPKLEEWAS